MFLNKIVQSISMAIICLSAAGIIINKDFEDGTKLNKTMRCNCSGVAQPAKNEQKKIFLKQVLENNMNQSNPIHEASIAGHTKLEYGEQKRNGSSRELCDIKPIEISTNIKFCGRVRLNTSSCQGMCRSNSKLISNLSFQQKLCSSCQAHEFEHTTYKIKCFNGTLTTLTLKGVRSCSCSENFKKLVPVEHFYKKNNFTF